MESIWRYNSQIIISSDDSSDDEAEGTSGRYKMHDLLSSDEESPRDSNHKERRCKHRHKHEQDLFSNSDSSIISEDENGVMSSDVSQDGDNSDTFYFAEGASSLSNNKSNSKHSTSSTSSSKQNEKLPHKHTPKKNLIKERQSELLNAKKFYELELMREKARLENLEATAKHIKVSTLPDKGAKLRSSIEKQVTKVKELNDQLVEVSSNIVHVPSLRSTSKPKKSGVRSLTIEELVQDHTNLSEMGKKALADHKVQQSETVETLTRLHKFFQTLDSKKTVSEPTTLKISLLPHQKVALSWLLRRESDIPQGGILADDMGLGKTLTIIALILKNLEMKSQEKNSSHDEDSNTGKGHRKLPDGKTLIVCPSSVLGQWASEVSSKVKPGTLSVYIHHGANRETAPHNLSDYDLVLTTYSILQHENKKGAAGTLVSINWKRVVLDEAHIIRNHKSKTANAVFALRARKRWALTGTPIHNKQEDFFSLLKFLNCKPFDDLAVWKKMVDNRRQLGLERLHLLTKSLLLRRTKEEIQKAGGLKGLKPKEFINIKVKLDSEERKVYKRISYFCSALLARYIYERAEKENLLTPGLNSDMKSSTNPFSNHPELGRLYNRMMGMKGDVKTYQILVLLLRLRQICCHASLVTSMIDSEEFGIGGVEDNEGNDLGLLDQMMNLSLARNGDREEPSKKLITSDDPVFSRNRCSSKMREVIKCVSNVLEKGDDKIIIVSQWTSVLEIINSFLAKRRIETVALNGTIPVKYRIGIIDNFNNPGGPKVLLLSLTAGGIGLNLVGANHLILVDVHWNPQLEAQACDRIYRVGQNKTVHIYKFVCTDTIEERIVELQNEKLGIAKGVLTGISSTQASKLSLRDLKKLFDIN